jgi:hypothetical protein
MKFSALTLANLIVAAILLLTPFLVGLTSSAPYDPWYDLNESGKIDIFDVVMLASTYGTLGDPGKNVNVTNWPSTWKSITYVEDSVIPITANPLLLGFYWGLDIEVEGYSRMFIYVEAWGFNPVPDASVEFGVRDLNWRESPGAKYAKQDTWSPYFNCGLGNRTYKQMMEFKTCGPLVEPGLGISSPTMSGTAHVSITVYLRNE